jgi:hypothetical protein
MTRKKKSENDLEKLNYIRDYLERRASAKGIDSEVNTFADDEGDKYLLFRFACNGYTANLKLMESISSIDIELGFTYPNSNTLFCIDDVFNVLDINDFKDYFFDADIEDEQSQAKAIDDVLYLLDKYDYDIRKAGGEIYFTRMQNMHDEDQLLYNSNDVKIRNILKLTMLERKMRKSKSDKDKNAYIKFAQKQKDTVGIDNKTKRYVAYLNAGYAIPDCEEYEDDNEVKYDKRAIGCYILCDIMGVLIAFGIFAINRAVISQKGVLITFGAFEYICALVSGIALGYILSKIFGTKIILALTNQNDKESIKKCRKNRFDDLSLIDKIFSKYVLPVLSTALFALTIMLSCSAICITDSSIIDHTIVGNNEYAITDTVVYQCEGYYDDDDKFIKYEYPDYLFYTADDDYFIETGEVTDEKAQEKLESVFKKYGVEPILVHSEKEIQE